MSEKANINNLLQLGCQAARANWFHEYNWANQKLISQRNLTLINVLPIAAAFAILVNYLGTDMTKSDVTMESRITIAGTILQGLLT